MERDKFIVGEYVMLKEDFRIAKYSTVDLSVEIILEDSKERLLIPAYLRAFGGLPNVDYVIPGPDLPKNHMDYFKDVYVEDSLVERDDKVYLLSYDKNYKYNGKYELKPVHSAHRIELCSACRITELEIWRRLELIKRLNLLIKKDEITGILLNIASLDKDGKIVDSTYESFGPYDKRILSDVGIKTVICVIKDSDTVDDYGLEFTINIKYLL